MVKLLTSYLLYSPICPIFLKDAFCALLKLSDIQLCSLDFGNGTYSISLLPRLSQQLQRGREPLKSRTLHLCLLVFNFK